MRGHCSAKGDEREQASKWRRGVWLAAFAARTACGRSRARAVCQLVPCTVPGVPIMIPTTTRAVETRRTPSPPSSLISARLLGAASESGTAVVGGRYSRGSSSLACRCSGTELSASRSCACGPEDVARALPVVVRWAVVPREARPQDNSNINRPERASFAGVFKGPHAHGTLMTSTRLWFTCNAGPNRSRSNTRLPPFTAFT